ncbi:MAG: ABC transporter ATP-binding protein [Pseudomonadota bacterium]
MLAWFEGLIDPYQAYDDRTPPPGRLDAFFAAFLQPARWLLIASLSLSFIVGAADALTIYYAAELIDALAGSTPESFWAENGAAVIWMLVVVGLIRPIAAIIDRLLMGQGFFPNMGALIRWRTHRHMLRQSVSFFNDDFAGRIANKQIQIAPAFNNVVFQMLDAIWYFLTFFVVAFFMFADLDLRLMIPLLIWAGLFVLAAWYFVPRIGKVGKDVAEARSRLAGRIVDSYTNIQTVKLFAHAEREEEYARAALEDMRTEFQKMTRLHTWLSVALLALNTVLLIGVVGYAALLWGEGAVGVGVVAGAATLALRLQGMTEWIMWTLSNLFESIGVVQEGMETVSQPWRMVDQPAAPALHAPRGRVTFESVAHRYGRGASFRGKGVGVNQVSLDIAPGERVGLVGRSGAGKSTLVNLLLRFFDPEEGRILIDGQDIAAVRQDTLRAQIGMVTQDTSLLHRSIHDNIAYGWPRIEEASPEEAREAVIEAAKKVAAHEFIMELSDRDGRTGYDAYVGERGVKLSGGQRQRIALARVVLKDAPIMVLDEATSALDSEAEAAILEAMETLMKGKTVIAIAHRLSTIAQMDRIVVMDQGVIAEEGARHERLLAQGGLYAQLWARQSGGFIGVDDGPGDAVEAAE